MLGAAKGCVVVLTGDYHKHDIKKLRPGSNAYGYRGERPIHQLMSSGLTNSTARPERSCEELGKDGYGLRVGGECGIWGGPAFGSVEVDWEAEDPVVQLRVRDGEHGFDRSSARFVLSNCDSPPS